MGLILIGMIIMVCVLVYKYKEFQQNVQQQEQERKTQEENRRKEEELASKQLEDCKNMWRESALYKTIFPQIKKVLTEHLHSAENKYFKEGRADNLFVKICNDGIRIVNYDGCSGFEWDHNTGNHHMVFCFDFNENGYENIAEQEIMALEHLLAENLQPWIDTTDIQVELAFHEIRLYYNKCYKNKKSVFTH